VVLPANMNRGIAKAAISRRTPGVVQVNIIGLLLEKLNASNFEYLQWHRIELRAHFHTHAD
jgi:hypothetical protein